MNEPRTLTEAIARVGLALQALPWTDQVYGRAARQDQQGPGQERPQWIPLVHAGDGEYRDCRPNDDHRSVIFFATRENERNDWSQERPGGHASGRVIRPRRAVSIIGWVNLSQLNGAWDDGSGFPELVKVSLKDTLKTLTSCVASIDEYIDEPLSEVYKGFRVSDLDRKYDRYPFACFRQDIHLYTIEKR